MINQHHHLISNTRLGWSNTNLLSLCDSNCDYNNSIQELRDCTRAQLKHINKWLLKGKLLFQLIYFLIYASSLNFHLLSARVYIRLTRFPVLHFVRPNHKQINPTPTINQTNQQALNGFLMMLTQKGKLLYISDNAAEYLGHSMVSWRKVSRASISSRVESLDAATPAHKSQNFSLAARAR